MLPWVVAALAACGGGRSAALPGAAAAAGGVPERPSGSADLGPASTIVVPPLTGRRAARAAALPTPPHPWTAAPPGSTERVFREVLVGKLPSPAARNTWWLLSSGNKVYLRIEEQKSIESMPQLDRTVHFAELWLPPLRTEYVGSMNRTSPPFTLKLLRSFGSREPAELTLVCRAKNVAVHPAFATLVEGWKNDDETMEPAVWAPTRTERVAAIGCQLPNDPWPFPFGEGLSFAPGKTTAKLTTAGLEWAFVNSDMVIQEGGYRFIPSFSLGTP